MDKAMPNGSAPSIPIIGTPPRDPNACEACHGTGYYWDCGGHGAFDWKRPCSYCKRGRV